MSDKKDQIYERTNEEAKIEDLPVDEPTTANVKGGAGKADLVNSIAD